jgi:hypothetical protein
MWAILKDMASNKTDKKTFALLLLAFLLLRINTTKMPCAIPAKIRIVESCLKNSCKTAALNA